MEILQVFVWTVVFLIGIVGLASLVYLVYFWLTSERPPVPVGHILVCGRECVNLEPEVRFQRLLNKAYKMSGERTRILVCGGVHKPGEPAYYETARHYLVGNRGVPNHLVCTPPTCKHGDGLVIKLKPAIGTFEELENVRALGGRVIIVCERMQLPRVRIMLWWLGYHFPRDMFSTVNNWNGFGDFLYQMALTVYTVFDPSNVLLRKSRVLRNLGVSVRRAQGK